MTAYFLVLGTMSEAELHVIKQRMHQGKLSKARRGELGFAVPTGYVRNPSGSDLRSRRGGSAGGGLIFKKFEELGTLNAMLRYLVANDIRLGVRVREGEAKGELEWRRPNRMTLQNTLKNPIYAGAYAYGKRRIDPAGKSPDDPYRKDGGASRRVARAHQGSSAGLHKLGAMRRSNLRRLEDNRAVADAKVPPERRLAAAGPCGLRLLWCPHGGAYHGSDRRYSYVCSPGDRLRRIALPVHLRGAA